MFVHQSRTKLIIAFLAGLVFLSFIFFQIINLSIRQEDEKIEQASGESFSLMGRVLDINLKDNYIIIAEESQKEEIKIIMAEDTEIFKILYLPEPEDDLFTTKRAHILLEGIKQGDLIFIKSKDNIFDKKTIDNIEYLEVL